MFDQLVPVLTFLVTAGIKEFVEKVLGGTYDARWSAITAAIVGAAMVFANQLGALLPTAWLPVVGQIVQLIVMIAAAFGIHATAKMIGKK